MEQKKVHVYYTGGTIGMTATTPRVEDPVFAKRVASELENVDGLPKWDFEFHPTRLDSSNMTPADWKSIADYIAGKQDDYDAFVILHGTDTMAYTTSALTFMIAGLKKPVIFTGSQIPLAVPCNDARWNLIASLRIAGNYPLPKPEVCLFFKDKLLRGSRATKVSADELDAFDSPNFPPLCRAPEGGEIKCCEQVDVPPHFDPLASVAEDGSIKLNEQGELLPPEVADVPLHVQEFTEKQVGLLRLFPGITDVITRNFLQSPMKGAVLHAFGSGNGPSDPKFRQALKDAVDRGVVIVACTQCLRGSVDLDLYETGLGEERVVSGYDMTAEAAVTKLFWLLTLFKRLSPTLRPLVVGFLMRQNLRGELTRPDPSGNPRIPCEDERSSISPPEAVFAASLL